MFKYALVTDSESLSFDFDMDLLIKACESLDLNFHVTDWTDSQVNWSSFDHIILRSPWSYTSKLDQFIRWCETVSKKSNLCNPLAAIQWNLDKHYLLDLESNGIPIVPTMFIEEKTKPFDGLKAFLDTNSDIKDFVIKPVVGAYSRNVGRFNTNTLTNAASHIDIIHKSGCGAIIQPYVTSIDANGETNLIYFNGSFSHSIRKNALLTPDGTVHVPATEFRSVRLADYEELNLASKTLNAVNKHLGLKKELLYARVDLIRDHTGRPMVLELEICEPSLSLPFFSGSEKRFAEAISSLEADDMPLKP